MESLALLAALVMLSLWGLAGASILLSLAGMRLAGAALGFLSVLAGVWLLFVLPGVPLLGAVNVLAGVVALRRYLEREKT